MPIRSSSKDKACLVSNNQTLRKSIILTVFFCTAAFFGYSQDSRKLIRAKEFYKYGKYEAANSLLESDRQLRLVNVEAELIIGLCKYHLNQLDEAEVIFQKLVQLPKSGFREPLLYLARIYHARHQFKEASRYYKSYLKSLPANHEHRPMVRASLQRCANGLELKFREALAFVENLGPQINTPYDDFGAVQSPINNYRLYFSSDRSGSIGGMRNATGRIDNLLGSHRCDIYFSNQDQNGNWQAVQALDYLINSPEHEVIYGFDEAGKVLYYYKGDKLEGGQIFVDTFQRDHRRLNTDLLISPIDATANITIPYFLDARTVVFASRRPGGYGGYDLYQSSYFGGRWSTPQNLGPEINTAYDEVSPYLAPDRRSLYFSSNHPDRSLGGFDIFKSVYIPQRKQWSIPFNLGLGLNSAGDDTHFRLAKDGYTAYLTSNRKDGFGQRDIYVAYFYDFLPEINPKGR
jgi:tetratricopeptide (TPR) repeat protein